MHPTNEVDVLRIQLMRAEQVQQAAEIALSKEPETNIAEGVRALVDNAIRQHHKRHRLRRALGKAQRAVRYLERQAGKIVEEDQRPRPGSQLSWSSSSLRYSPLATNYTRHNRNPLARPCSPVTPTEPPVPDPPGMVELGRNGTSCADEPGQSLPRRPRPPLRSIWAPDNAPPNENEGDAEDHSFLGRLEPGIRVGSNGAENPVDLHAYRWRYQLRQLQRQASDARDYILYGYVNNHVDAIFSRQGRYAELVAAVFPDAPLDFSLDPATSKLGQEHMFDTSSLGPGDEIYEEDVARWMYAVLNISREVARLALEPYFRRRAHYYLAVQALYDVRIQKSISGSQTSASEPELRREFEHLCHSRKSHTYPGKVTVTDLILDGDKVVWYLPDKEDEVDDVAVDLAWLPTCIAGDVAARYRELRIASGV